MSLILCFLFLSRLFFFFVSPLFILGTCIFSLVKLVPFYCSSVFSSCFHARVLCTFSVCALKNLNLKPTQSTLLFVDFCRTVISSFGGKQQRNAVMYLYKGSWWENTLIHYNFAIILYICPTLAMTISWNLLTLVQIPNSPFEYVFYRSLFNLKAAEVLERT